MDGRLGEHPLAELIKEISEKGFSGALRIERERVKAVLYFEHGALVHATSNLRAHRLAEHLRQHGLASATVNDSASDAGFAEALLSEGLLSRQRLDEILAEQAASVMRVGLLWVDGAWGFDGRARISESLQVKVATQQLLLEANRRLDPGFVSSRFAGGTEVVSPAPTPPDGLNLLPAEAFLLSRVEGPISLDDLIALSGLPEADTKQIIYGLFLAGPLKRESWQPAFTTPPPQAAAPKIDKSSAKSKDTLVKAPVKPLPPPAAAKPDPRRELDAFVERLSQAADHYEVLDIGLSADLTEIKGVYHTIARNFHPDRFHELAGTLPHIRLQSAFARVTQAYETLTNPELRSAYDSKVHALRKARDSEATAKKASKVARYGSNEESENGENAAELAEKRFQEGAAALQQGQTNAATSFFSAAARLMPNEAKYRAHLGRALATNPKTRRLGEVELQAAVKLDPANASYHVMLATLYRDLGFALRAVSELDRALAIDPENAKARELLSTLEGKK